MVEKGIKGTSEAMVTESDTALAIGSGELEVYATPSMIALVEKTAWKSVVPYLAEGEGTVGSLVNVEHVSPTPIGMSVRCQTEVIEVDGRRLVFSVEVYDEQGMIGRGRHERFIIKNDRFQQKADAKRG